MDKNTCSLDPTPIVRITTAYWDSQAFMTANRIGMFEELAESPKTAEEISTALKTQVRPTKLLLNACVALGFLDKNEKEFRNTALANKYLVSGKPTFMGNAVRYSDDLYETWGQLEKCLREDRPMLEPSEYLGVDPERTRHFVYGMHNRALGTANALVGLVDLSARKKLLDIGGGPGTYSCLLTARYPQLSSQVLDLPDIVAHADEIIASMGQQEKVRTLPGDYHSTQFPVGNDVVLISGVFHRESEQSCMEIIKKAGESLVSGGLLIISDVFTDVGETSPSFATLFAINMALTATDGGIQADQDVVEWMRAVGFGKTEVKAFPPPMPHRLISATKI